MKNIILSISAIIITATVVYHYLIYIPQRDQAEVEIQKNVLGETNVIKPTNIPTPTIDDITRQRYIDLVEGKSQTIESEIIELKEKMEERDNCEFNDGKYLRSGACCLNNCENVH